MIVETERLLLRKPRLEDARDLVEAYSDPETVRYIGDGSTKDPGGTEEAIRRWLAHWDEWEIGFFVLERKVVRAHRGRGDVEVFGQATRLYSVER